MKKTLCFAALLGLVVLTSCSGDSPTAKPVPTVVPDTWSISSLQVSNTTPYVGSSIQVSASVTKNGSAAPDGTIVEFLANGGAFTSCGCSEPNVETEDGVASALFGATTAGGYTIQARVRGMTRQVSVSYRNRPTDDSLQVIQPLIPNIGSYDGGETVVIQGRGIRAPAEVTFDVNGTIFQAVVVNVLESKSATGSITIETPYISGTELRNEDREVGVTVTVGIGTGDEQNEFLPDAFTFKTGFTPGGAPGVFGVIPDTGRSSGGETVTILGRNFVVGDTTVRWTGQDIDLVSPTVTVSPDGLQIDAVTPRFSLNPVEEPIPLTVEATTSNGSSSLANAFLVLADEPTPEIASISPIAGPIDGGTLVTIFGSGFTGALTVTFGDLTAIDVNIFDDPSIADNDRITCLSPDYSQQGQTPPVSVPVQVTNVETGKQSNADNMFTYGDNLYISGNSPSEGRIGDEVTIYGSGFEDPLQVFHDASGITLEEQEVSGTQIRARFPSDADVFCGAQTGPFRVRMLESNLETQGGDYTLLGNTPRVTSVDPTFVQASASGNFVNPSDIVITGVHFAANLLVDIDDYTMASGDVTVVNSTTIEVQNIPAPNEFGFTFNTSACITNLGQEGTREEPTSVNVTVTNLPGQCSDVLIGALIYEPFDSSCVALPTPTPTATPTVTDTPTATPTVTDTPTATPTPTP